MKLEYFKNLDGLRGIAAFSVLIFHFCLDPRMTSDVSNIERVRQITEILQHGVTLFFVLSGFVITRILLNTKQDKNYFTNFYKRRVLRIFPLYYFYLLVHFYVFPTILGLGPNLEFVKQIPMYLYLQNMGWITGLDVIGPGHFWSLAVEEHFYLLWPLIVFIIPNKRIRYFTVLLIFLSIPLKIIFLKNGIDINHSTFTRYDSLMIGCFIAIIEKESNYILPKINVKILVTALFCLLLIGAIVFALQGHIFLLKASVKHLILGLFFGFVIYYLLTCDRNSFISKQLESPLMQYFGRISYGLYVWHIMAISVTGILAIESSFVNLFIAITITVLMAHLSYYYFERYFLKLK